MVKIVKSIFLNLLAVIKYKLSGVKRLLKLNKKESTSHEVSVGDVVNWAENYKDWAEKRYGQGPFVVLETKANNLMAVKVTKDCHLIKNRTPLLFLIKIRGGEAKRKGEEIWLEGNFFFGKSMYVYSK